MKTAHPKINGKTFFPTANGTRISPPLLVLKFGGKSLASVADIRNAARMIAADRMRDRRLVIVVSAMGPTTSELLEMANQTGGQSGTREIDALLACGETISACLFAMSLMGQGVDAISLTGAQAGIRVKGRGETAEIVDVDANRISGIIESGRIPVIAGFQGVGETGEIVTLGRGGSDLSAVAIASAVGAVAVECYKDIDGIYDEDPKQNPHSRRHEELGYAQALSVVKANGHQVVQAKAIDLAARTNIPIQIRSFAFPQRSGTWVRTEKPSALPPNGARQDTETDSDSQNPSSERRSEYDCTVFKRLESNVASYCHSFPCLFTRGRGSILSDRAGKNYIDFFAGAGALNLGHNPKRIRQCLVDYLLDDRIIHALDMHTEAKEAFIRQLEQRILQPKGLDYKIQFCGPTGANAVEAALKLARLATGRHLVASFTGGYHGLTGSSLAVTSGRDYRSAAGAPLGPSYFLPYPVGRHAPPEPIKALEALLEDPCSGLDLPAAILLETVQGEGGIYVAPSEWLKQLRLLCDQHNILLIVDDIQAGCGRTGNYFSFERAGITPDIVCLSKAVSGYGLPISLVLMKRELDVWKPGQHTGTFRGNQLAFVAGAEAIAIWSELEHSGVLPQRAVLIEQRLAQIKSIEPEIQTRGLGSMWGLDMADCGSTERAARVARICFENGLIIERSGPRDTVLKLLPPLTTDDKTLHAGLDILSDAVTKTHCKTTAGRR